MQQESESKYMKQILKELKEEKDNSVIIVEDSIPSFK